MIKAWCCAGLLHHLPLMDSSHMCLYTLMCDYLGKQITFCLFWAIKVSTFASSTNGPSCCVGVQINNRFRFSLCSVNTDWDWMWEGGVWMQEVFQAVKWKIVWMLELDNCLHAKKSLYVCVYMHVISLEHSLNFSSAQSRFRAPLLRCSANDHFQDGST